MALRGGKRLGPHTGTLSSASRQICFFEVSSDKHCLPHSSQRTALPVLLVAGCGERGWGESKGILECGNDCFPSRRGSGHYPRSAAYMDMPLSPTLLQLHPTAFSKPWLTLVFQSCRTAHSPPRSRETCQEGLPASLCLRHRAQQH